MADKNQSQPNPRDAIRDARAARLKLIQGDLPPPTVKVYAANEVMRGVLRHPSGNVSFRETLGEAVEWPNDGFTARRIAEGSVLTEPSSGGEWVRPDETKNVREHAEARKPKTKNGKAPPPAA